MIAIKILNVMTKIGPIIKDKTNEEKGFDYASIASIIIRAREAMIEEKVIMIPLKLNQVVQKGNDVIIDMVYRFYDAEPNEDGKCDYMDVNIPGEGADKEGWAVYKALSGAYKYAITQTFAIPTIDDAEKDKYTTNNEESNNNDTVTENVDAEGSLDENSIDKINPIEVKSGNYRGHKSLDVFCDKYSSRIRDKYVVHTKDYKWENGIHYLPVYMIPFL